MIAKLDIKNNIITKLILNNIEEFISFIPQKVIDDLGEPIIEESISRNLTFNNTYQRKSSNYQRGDYFYHPDIGYTFLSKVIKNPKNTFYKLITPGFEWDEDLNNY